MIRVGSALGVLLALIPASVAYAALLGLGVARHAPAWAVSASATFLLFAPPLAACLVASRHRTLAWAGTLVLWSLGLLLVLPVYFPGERREAVQLGIGLVTRAGPGEHLAERVANLLPADPEVSEPQLPEAVAIVEAPAPAPTALEDGEIALPYEGNGRNLSVPVVFENDGRVVDGYHMMLDTGATYTTLSHKVLAELGIVVTEADPAITLHTANGERQARIVLVDKVWLGDLLVEGVAISTCDDCSSSETVGLLGLNVAGAYNTTIDADRREVVFSTRVSYSRVLDVRPFVDLDLSFQRIPGGRVEVSARIENRSRRPISSLSVGVRCNEEEWSIDVGSVSARDHRVARNRLPRHEPCGTYVVTGLSEASW